jgi:type IV secretory pathway TraG/TraD family ATPase VirD4
MSDKINQELQEWKSKNPHAIRIPKHSTIGTYKSIFIGNPFRSVFVCGGAGSGKSETLFYRIIEHAIKKESPVLLYDYKSPELGNFAKSMNSKLPVYHIDFNNPQTSARVNPIAPKYITNPLIALELAQALYYNLNPKALTSNQDPFWNNSAISILQATIWYMKEYLPEKCSIPTLIDIVLRPIGDVLTELRKDDTCTKILAAILSSYDEKATNLLASISSTVQSPLSLLIGEDINYILGADETPLDINNPESPSILIIGQSQETPHAYSPLISLIITTSLRLMNKPDKRESYVILDEAPTIYIPRIEDYPAVTRSRRISFIYGAQDISQIDKAYGKDRREALLSNLGSHFFGRTPNKETLQYICSLFGKEDREYYSSNQGKSTSYGTEVSYGNNSGTSYSIQQRDVLQPSDILSFIPGQFAYIGSDVPPKARRVSVVYLMGFGLDHSNSKDTNKSSRNRSVLLSIFAGLGSFILAVGKFLLKALFVLFRTFTKLKID